MQHEFLGGKRKERKKKRMLATHQRYGDYMRRTWMKIKEAETNRIARWNNFFDHWVFD